MDIDPNSVRRTAPLVDASVLRAAVDARSLELGLTRDSLAAAAGIGRSTLFDWLAGTSAPTPSGWLCLAKGLDLDVPALLGRLGVRGVSEMTCARLTAGWTVGDVARHAGVSYATARAMETGRRVRPDAAARVGLVLGLPAPLVRSLSRVDTPAVTAIGLHLEQFRLQHGWTITAIARELGVTRQLVSAWMSGGEDVARHWYPKLAELTGVSVAELTEARQDSGPDEPGGLAP